MTREDTEICQITLKLIFYRNLCNRPGSLVCPPALQHVLAVPIHLPFGRELNEKSEINTCQVQSMETATLFLTL